MPGVWALDTIRFENSAWVHAAWAALALALAIVLISSRARRRTERFAQGQRVRAVLGVRRRWLLVGRWTLATLGVALLGVGAARPQANPHTEQTETKGRDLVFVVDVSRSMLARDVAPNRLERAKLWIRDLVSELGDDRVALVAFAGSSSVRSPLTTDRLFFDLALEELGSDSVRMGGTNIGDAIRRCLELVFYDLSAEDRGTHRDIILITDGEDQDSLPVQAASAAGAQGVRIIAIGVGSRAGARVIDEDGREVTRSGRPVETSLDADQLAEIATATPGGVYLDVGTGDIDLAQVYRDLIANADQATLGNASVTTWDELYAYAAAPGAALLLLELALATRPNRRRHEA